MPKIIFEDTREKPKAVELINKQFEALGFKCLRSKLYVGDYQLIENPYTVVDRKQNLLEICSNITYQHDRFTQELLKAREAGIKIIFLVEHGKDITSLDDVAKWKNPRLRTSSKATSGKTLAKAMRTIEVKYNTKFVFCEKNESGKKIVEILEKESRKCMT